MTAPESKNVAKPFVRPSRSPEDLADIVSSLSNQQKAEMTYELVLFAAQAADETGHEALSEFLSELENLAEVYTDPARRRELQNSIRRDSREVAAALTDPPAL